jgi:cation/acetate symporter
LIYERNTLAIVIFAVIVGATLGLSFWLGRRARSASGFFAAGGHIHWFVNGVAFAGDYLSAASFLGICGMIAFYGYDGFLYSIGYLAGWVVALFVIAEPLKRMGKYTFADALDSRFNSPAIKLSAAISTLAVSIFYLIPQMVGAGALVTPLFGLPHWIGVVMVGATVIVIVATAGMVSTTYVQFLKGGLLVIFSTVLVGLILNRGLSVQRERPESQTIVTKGDAKFTNGLPQGKETGQADLKPVGTISRLPSGMTHTGPVGPIEFLRTVHGSEIVLWKSEPFVEADGATGTIYRPVETEGRQILRPGNYPAFAGLRGNDVIPKLNFLSLMLALFCGTASLPHILIRYYTVKDQASARKSTIVGIGTIGFFYILTLYLGLGAMTSGALDVTDSNMAAPLLAKSFSNWLFAVISAIAFTTVLGTVSGLIIAASGAVVHDLMKSVLRIQMGDAHEVRVARFASVGVGAIAIVLVILF